MHVRDILTCRLMSFYLLLHVISDSVARMVQRFGSGILLLLPKKLTDKE